MEMEACHLDLLVPDGEAKDSLLRLRKQMALTEKKPRALTIRFVAPERVPVPVIDLFTKWNSRALSAFPGSAVTWNCAARNEVIPAVQRVPALPGFGTVISGNGGRYMERACDVSGEAVCECAFPLHG